jgi:hypothetical protein
VVINHQFKPPKGNQMNKLIAVNISALTDLAASSAEELESILTLEMI